MDFLEWKCNNIPVLVWTNISSIYYFTQIHIILKQHIPSDWIIMNLKKTWGDVLRTLSAHGYSKYWRTSLSINKPTTWFKSGQVSLVSSSCLYKTQPRGRLHKYVMLGQMRWVGTNISSIYYFTEIPMILKQTDGRRNQYTPQQLHCSRGIMMVTLLTHIRVTQPQLDESTAHRQLKSSRSLSGRSIHLTLVTKCGHGHEWPTATPFVKCQSALPFRDTAISKFDQDDPWSWSCVWSKVKVMFDLQNSKVKVMVKVRPIGHIWGLGFNLYVCFSFCGNRTTFGWDIANSIFDLENSRSRSWPRSNPMVTFEP